MIGSPEFSSFPVREGGSVPREFVLPLEDGLNRGYGISLKSLARRGGVSVYELLLLLPPPEGMDPSDYKRRICELTISEALRTLDNELTKYHKKKEAEAEAEMLRMMEEGADQGAETEGAV